MFCIPTLGSIDKHEKCTMRVGSDCISSLEPGEKSRDWIGRKAIEEANIDVIGARAALACPWLRANFLPKTDTTWGMEHYPNSAY